MDNTARGKYLNSTRRKIILILSLTITLAVASIAVLGIGGVNVDFINTFRVIFHPIFPDHIAQPDFPYYTNIIVDYRMPRVLLGILTGMCLAVAGASMQGIMKNPLADPFTLGLSSAASCGAGVGIILGPTILGSLYYSNISFFGEVVGVSSLFMVMTAFVFGLVSVVILLSLTGRRQVSQSTLILTGVVIGYLFSAVLSYLKYISDEEALKDITLWLLGGMWGSSWSAVIIVLPIAILGIILLETYAVDLNALSSGDDVAKNLGVNVQSLRRRILIISALMTSACMAFTGIIGFIGLMAPHIVRMLIGNDHRYLIPVSALMGALILVLCDTVARVIVAPSDLPVGIIMYVLGGMFFMFLIKKMRGGYEI
ncbi:FecCD family ABC transporter permease [Candidatus Methanoprimaticola sp. MG2]|uniref:FecCD family ABC transporter permease n=1 Tax=Candidatus Methanoprimaticola sp. MG2 TaxID=3228838 RepID=UPI0039C756BA